jgi:hypothetical protein
MPGRLEQPFFATSPALDDSEFSLSFFFERLSKLDDRRKHHSGVRKPSDVRCLEERQFLSFSVAKVWGSREWGSVLRKCH